MLSLIYCFTRTQKKELEKHFLFCVLLELLLSEKYTCHHCESITLWQHKVFIGASLFIFIRMMMMLSFH